MATRTSRPWPAARERPCMADRQCWARGRPRTSLTGERLSVVGKDAGSPQCWARGRPRTPPTALRCRRATEDAADRRATERRRQGRREPAVLVTRATEDAADGAQVPPGLRVEGFEAGLRDRLGAR